MENKTCNDCRKEFPKNSENFNWLNKKKGYYSPYCKSCTKVRNSKTYRSYYDRNSKEVCRKAKEYREANKELVRERKQVYYQENKEGILEYQAEYRSLESTKARMNEYEKQRRNNNPAYKLHTNVSRLIRLALNNEGENGTKGKIWDNLPYTDTQLKEHLESQFDENMTWDNYGSYWHVDHIVPRSRLEYDDFSHPNFLKCWCLENLQPLEAKENIRKSNKMRELLAGSSCMAAK